MELKEYQQMALDRVKQFLELLAKERAGGNARHASLDAWGAMDLKVDYRERQNGIEQDLPNFCLKIPTGGGKTFLAVKTIDLMNTTYRKKRTGLVLWIVPTTQIYRQTLQALRDREHPYRQHLDIASGGRTMVVEKGDRFTPVDVQENLVVLMLMLPSANRQTKETLRIFKDNGGFQEFFPLEDAIEEQRKLLERIPNLDTYGKEGSFWQRQVKTSLGNTLRLLSPIIILDEGHKAYSEGAQETLRGFNPSIIVELSATPPKESNVLVDIRGIELNREEMIKLDLHIINKASADWKDTLRASVAHRNVLEKIADEYHANTGNYIRPINLIQVERTGKDQRDGRHIHADDARDFLINAMGIPPEQIAIKTSEKDELKAVDDVGGLMSRYVSVRYIITKQALQEGWDCAFAYVLTILTNPTSKNALTQLVGRILRQPLARKTKVKELDESYVFVFQQRGKELLDEIRKGFGQEGLGDLAGSVVGDEGMEDTSGEVGEETYEVREKFRKVAEQVVLPVFVLKEDKAWRKLDYEMDILRHIPWNEIDLASVCNLPLSSMEEKDVEQVATLSDDIAELVKYRDVQRLKEGGIVVDPVFMARHLIDIVPNGWIAYEFGRNVLQELSKKYKERVVVNNFVYIIEELRKQVAAEKDRLAEKVFREMVKAEGVRFMVISRDELGFKLPQKLKVKKAARPLLAKSGMPLQRSLFEFIPKDAVNDEERNVVWYLDDNGRLLFWYRNIARQDYAIQGWRKDRIYPDFLFTTVDGKEIGFDEVFVVETKGVHLNNEDTKYKQSVFELCNQQAKKGSWSELALAMKDRAVHFEVVFGDEWQRKLNVLLS